MNSSLIIHSKIFGFKGLFLEFAGKFFDPFLSEFTDKLAYHFLYRSAPAGDMRQKIRPLHSFSVNQQLPSPHVYATSCKVHNLILQVIS